MTYILNRHWHDPPSWLKKASGKLPLFDFEFENDRHYMLGVEHPQTLPTFTRATVAWYDRGDGVWVQAASGQMRRNTRLGVLFEAARTNRALWNRDMTNVVWVKTTMTAAKDQTGIDGVANSASSLTATAGNALVLQTVVLASTVRRQAAFVKRITGSGTIQMTTDGGTTWVTITVTTDWAQVAIPQQTVTNPVFGFRIVTSGDAIAVDMVGNESIPAGEADVYTSPIATTTVAVTRNADQYSLLVSKIPGFSASAGTLFVEAHLEAVASAGSQIYAGFDDTTVNNRVVLRNAVGNAGFVTVSGGVTQANLTQTIAAVGRNRAVGAWGANDFRSIFSTTSTAPLFGAADAAGTVPTVTQFSVGSSLGSTHQGRAHIRRVAYWPSALSNGDLLNLIGIL